MSDSRSRPGPRLHPLSGLLLAAAVGVFAVQLVMRATASATSWRGGGFGMYASPHPASYRAVVAERYHSDGVDRIRLIPQDSTVVKAVREMSDPEAERFDALRRRASRSRTLPTARRAEDIARMVARLAEAQLFGPGGRIVRTDSVVVSFHELRPHVSDGTFTFRELSRGVHRVR